MPLTLTQSGKIGQKRKRENVMQKQDKKKTRFVDIFPCSFAVAFVYQFNQRAVAALAVYSVTMLDSTILPTYFH